MPQVFHSVKRFSRNFYKIVKIHFLDFSLTPCHERFNRAKCITTRAIHLFQGTYGHVAHLVTANCAIAHYTLRTGASIITLVAIWFISPCYVSLHRNLEAKIFTHTKEYVYAWYTQRHFDPD